MIWEQVLGIAGALFLLICCFIPRDPTQCNFIGALVGGALGLIGASKQRKEQRRINEANRPVNQVREWEEAGINPLFGISSGGYVPYQAASIGDAYSVAGARFGQAIDQFREEKLAQTELKKENTALKEKLDELATPRIPSYLSQYGAIIPVPTIGGTNAQAVQNGNRRSGVVSPVSGGGGSVDSLGATSDVAPGRDVEVSPYTSGSGLTEINNRFTNGIVVPGSDGEPWGIDEVATYLAVGVPQMWWDFQTNEKYWKDGTFMNPASRRTGPKPEKANTKTKAYRDFMKSAYPTAFD